MMGELPMQRTDGSIHSRVTTQLEILGYLGNRNINYDFSVSI